MPNRPSMTWFPDKELLEEDMNDVAGETEKIRENRNGKDGKAIFLLCISQHPDSDVQ